MRRVLGFAIGWLLAVVAAVTIALIAVTTVDDTLQGRGPLGEDFSDLPSPRAVDEQIKGLPRVEREISGEYGVFRVACQGPYALGLSAEPAQGWRVVSYEPGPDDDVDAVFASRDRSADLEVFCNQGEPNVEIEHNQLPGSVDDD